MDAKIKAQELIDKYAVNVDIFCNVDNEDYIPNGLLTNKSSIKLALIAVNELLEAQPSYRYWDTYDDETPSAITFWNEVKAKRNFVNNFKYYRILCFLMIKRIEKRGLSTIVATANAALNLKP